MNSVRYILGLSMAMGLQGCTKDPLEIVVDDLAETCLAVERTNEPCGYRRGSLPEEYGGMCLTTSGMEIADKKLQERTNCQLIVFAREYDGAPDYFVLRKNCDLKNAHPGKDEGDYSRVYPQ